MGPWASGRESRGGGDLPGALGRPAAVHPASVLEEPRPVSPLDLAAQGTGVAPEPPKYDCGPFRPQPAAAAESRAAEPV